MPGEFISVAFVRMSGCRWHVHFWRSTYSIYELIASDCDYDRLSQIVNTTVCWLVCAFSSARVVWEVPAERARAHAWMINTRILTSSVKIIHKSLSYLP